MRKGARTQSRQRTDPRPVHYLLFAFRSEEAGRARIADTGDPKPERGEGVPLLVRRAVAAAVTRSEGHRFYAATSISMRHENGNNFALQAPPPFRANQFPK